MNAASPNRAKPGWPVFTLRQDALTGPLGRARLAQGTVLGLAHALGLERHPETRDLSDLTEKGVLEITGQGRGTRYWIAGTAASGLVVNAVVINGQTLGFPVPDGNRPGRRGL